MIMSTVFSASVMMLDSTTHTCCTISLAGSLVDLESGRTAAILAGVSSTRSVASSVVGKLLCSVDQLDSASTPRESFISTSFHAIERQGLTSTPDQTQHQHT